MMKEFSLIIAGALALCLAAISGTYWFEELAGQPDWQRGVAIAASVFVSVMTFFCAYFIRSHGRVLAVSVVIFFAADTYQNAQGWQTFKGLSSSEDLVDAKARLKIAMDQLVNLPTPDAKGAIRKDSTHKNTTERLTQNISLFQGEVDRLQAPETPILIVGVAMGLIQIALAIFFACMGHRGSDPDIAESADTIEETGENIPDHSNNILTFKRPAPEMDAKDLKAWNAISSA